MRFILVSVFLIKFAFSFSLPDDVDVLFYRTCERKSLSGFTKVLLPYVQDFAEKMDEARRAYSEKTATVLYSDPMYAKYRDEHNAKIYEILTSTPFASPHLHLTVWGKALAAINQPCTLFNILKTLKILNQYTHRINSRIPYDSFGNSIVRGIKLLLWDNQQLFTHSQATPEEAHVLIDALIQQGANGLSSKRYLESAEMTESYERTSLDQKEHYRLCALINILAAGDDVTPDAWYMDGMTKELLDQIKTYVNVNSPKRISERVLEGLVSNDLLNNPAVPSMDLSCQSFKDIAPVYFENHYYMGLVTEVYLDKWPAVSNTEIRLRLVIAGRWAGVPLSFMPGLLRAVRKYGGVKALSEKMDYWWVDLDGRDANAEGGIRTSRFRFWDYITFKSSVFKDDGEYEQFVVDIVERGKSDLCDIGSIRDYAKPTHN